MIISIKSSASGGSSRGLVHYLAHSKLDREREGIERREFFNESENDLDVSRANRNLSRDNSKPQPEELLHVVIAPSKDETESVGDDLESKKTALESVVRETIARLEKEVKARNLKWIAVAHFNTDNPHAHVAIQKQFTNEDGKTEILRINRQMLHYNERGENGEKKLHKGALILAAESKIKEIAGERQKARENDKNFDSQEINGKSQFESGNSEQISTGKTYKISNFNERRTLAEEMLVSAEIQRRERNIENLVEHGDKKRFKIKDETTGNTRHVSLFDIERKIEIVSRRKSRLAQPNNAEKRAELAAKIVLDERAKHASVIGGLETIRRHVLGFENRHLQEAQEKHARLHSQKLLIEKKYERLKTAPPIPLFKPDEIQQLQSEAFREQNLEKILTLENIRQSNAKELNRPSRRDEDVRELLAAKTVAELKMQAAEKRLREFPASKNFVKVKINDSFWSRNLLERHELRANRKNDLWTQVKSKTSEFLYRPNKKNSSAVKLNYPALHRAVSEALEISENTRRIEVEKLKEFNQTLNEIFAAETNPNKTKLAPAFSSYEIAEAEDLALNAGRENFYENAILLQENWLREKLTENLRQAGDSKARSDSEEIKNQKLHSPTGETRVQFQSEPNTPAAAEKIIGKFVLERAEARSVIARTKAIEAQENLDRYSREKFFVKHQIKDAKTGAEREVSLTDVEPRRSYYLLDSILEKALESKKQKNLRDAVRQADEKQEKELAQKLKDAENRAQRLENQKAEMLEKLSVQPAEIQPIFTPKEIAALDIRAAGTINKSEAERLEKIVNDAEKKGRVERIQDLLGAAAKELQLVAVDLTKNQELKISHENNSPGERQTINLTQEISIGGVSSEAGIRTNAKSAESVHEKTVVKEKGRIR
ncbi:MAG: hypothetical protein ABI891_07105 [Acidobacteriota bacterium]